MVYTTSMFPCLILTPWMAPHAVVQWQKAICHEYTGEVDVLERYAEEARSPSIVIRFPCVARLNKRLVSERKDIKFSRANVYARDHHMCQYCGVRPGVKGLNYDHVHPKSKGGKTDWWNVVSSCIPCNLRKGNKTLKQAGVKLLNLPVQPKSLPMSASPVLLPREVPELWLPYLMDRMARLAHAI
jgi:5-methylcytosine-specific restriction endonuclease McrA